MGETVDFGAARAKRIDNNAEWTPVEALKEAVREIENGENEATACLVLFYEKCDDDTFRTGWTASNLQSSQMIALMEMVKATLLRDMGVI